MPKFAITGPDRDTGNRGPSSNPIFNQGTLRFSAPQGQPRNLHSDLEVDLVDSPYIYKPPVKLLEFTAMDFNGKIMVGPFQIDGPSKTRELSVGQRVYQASLYGAKGGIPFPEQISEPGKPVFWIFRWRIVPEVGEGELLLPVGIEAEDIWIDDEKVIWLP